MKNLRPASAGITESSHRGSTVGLDVGWSVPQVLAMAGLSRGSYAKVTTRAGPRPSGAESDERYMTPSSESLLTARTSVLDRFASRYRPMSTS